MRPEIESRPQSPRVTHTVWSAAQEVICICIMMELVFEGLYGDVDMREGGGKRLLLLLLLVLLLLSLLLVCLLNPCLVPFP